MVLAKRKNSAFRRKLALAAGVIVISGSAIVSIEINSKLIK